MNTLSKDLEHLGDDVVLSRYTDAQAVEDGILVRLNKRDRVTRAVWEFLVEHQPAGPKPPDCWPVDLFAWFGAKKPAFADDPVAVRMYHDIRAKALATGLIGAHGQAARRVYEENIGGGIWKAQALVEGGAIQGLHVRGGGKGHSGEAFKDLWLIPNDNGGSTLMFSEDY